MFGIGKIKPGDYIFSVKKDNDNNMIIVGRVQSVHKNILNVIGFFVNPRGLIERKLKGIIGKRSTEVLQDPDPNNCIFILIDRIETGNFSGEINQEKDKVIWINEKRYFILDGWVRENLPDMVADVLYSTSEAERHHSRSLLMEKMNSLYDKDLKEHLYAVARSTKIL
ncbi:MAG: hypothetical protein ACE5SW_01210 [Nitrososphaeraceae archaeon]